MTLRIKRLDFSPWGCFEDHHLIFDAKPGQVDLVYGPNASGKSTTSRGERSLLYGVEARTPDNHTYSYPDLRIGALLEIDGSLLEVNRRKRRGESLTDGDGKPVPQVTIAKAVGGLSEDVYRGLFQVDHDTLVQGGAELLQGQGEIGASLFAAAAGIATLHDTLTALDTEAEKFFSPRARSSELHKALAVLRAAEKRLREATLRPARYRELTRAVRDAEQECETLGIEIRELELNARALERGRALAPLLDAHATRRVELDELADTPDLAEISTAQRADAQGRLHAGSAALKRAQENCLRLAAEIETIEIDGPLLARAEEIRSVNERISAVAKAKGDRRKREGELRETETALRSAASVIGVADPADIEGLRRPASAHRALDAYLSEHDELASRRSSSQERVKQAERELKAARDELGDLPPAAETEPLEVAVTSALKAGALAEQIEEVRLDAGVLEREAIDGLANLHPSVSAPAELGSLTVPSREQARRAAEERAGLVKELDELRAAQQRLCEAERDVAEERARLTLAGAPPSAEALAQARSAREDRWIAIRSDATAGTPLPPGDAHLYERTVSDADRLADTRGEHAAQLERSAAVEARTRRLEREQEDLAAREREILKRGMELDEAWQDRWRATGLSLIADLDAEAWLEERDVILQRDRAASEQLARAQMLAGRERTHREALEAELRKLCEPPDAEAALETLVARAQVLLAGLREQASVRSALEATVHATERALSNAVEECEECETAVVEWEERWPMRRSEAGLPDTATPRAAQETVRAVEDGLGQLARKQDLERRIAGIDADQEEFDSDVRSICGELAPELTAVEPPRAAGAVHAKLAATERLVERRESVVAQYADASKELAAAEADIAGAQQEITALVVAAGAKSAEELPGIEARAARARTLRAEIAEFEDQVERVGEGRFAELTALSVGFERDGAAVELEELRERLEDLHGRRDEAKELVGESRRELARVETDTAAVHAAQDVALARVGVRDAAISHAKAKLAATVVRRAIERYRRLHQDPLLERANRLFTRVTLGSFVELFVDLDERGRGVLIGRERDRVLKPVPGMSKGTREQLFLALRIAAIERYVASSGPVPVIFDDVFIESDEPRSERIFEALGELALQTQVIVLTHHRHLIDVGRRALGDNMLVQSLPDAAPTLREVVAA